MLIWDAKLQAIFQGRKMSKTLGNVIDPLDTIKDYGTDALRFTLSLGTAGQVCDSFFYFGMYCVVKFVCLSVIKTLFFLQDLNLSTERLTSNKAFTNKLWNAGKFLLQNLPDRSDVSAWDALLANKVPK